MTTSAVQEYANLAKRVEFPTGEVDQKIDLVDTEITKLKELGKTLLGIERKSAEPQIAAKISELNSRRRQFVSAKKAGRLATTFAQLSLEPLKWRDKDGLPRLVLFGLNSPNFELSVKARYRDYSDNLAYKNTITPDLPEILQDYYSDVLQDLRKRAIKERKSIKLSTTWTGILPLEARQAIVTAKKDFKHIFIVAEPRTGWETTKTAAKPKPKPRPVPDPDPLIVGFDGDGLWLIHQFDVTTLESYVAREFRL